MRHAFRHPAVRRTLRAVIAACALAALPTGATSAGGQQVVRREIEARQARPGDLVIDGVLDEPFWATVPAAADFTQQIPFDGAPATQRTEARFAYDADNLYVGLVAYDTRPDSIADQLARRDLRSEMYSDWLLVAIDSYYDRRTAFVFGINPAGVQFDVFRFNDIDRDESWDAVWQSRVGRRPDGWTAELRIPLSQLRFTPPADGRPIRWGINVLREIARNGERSFWNPTPASSPAIVSRFGDLVGLEGLREPGKLELIPYARSQATIRNGFDGNDPFAQAISPDVAAGLDFRYRLPEGLTLSGAVNPDFGQVEADPAVVNLTQFEVFFPERRPFFLEGTDIFQFGRTITSNDNSNNTFFYTRRVGRAPRGGVGDAVYADVPGQTGITAAAKVSGKTRRGLSVGMLAAVTDRETGRGQDVLGDVRRATVEPRSEVFVGRLRQDFRGGNTVVGGFASGVSRSIADTALLSVMPRRAFVGGADFEHAWGNRTWAVSGVAAATQAEGDPRFLTALQRAAPRVFQRPDADWLGVDSARRALGGYYGALSVARTGGRRWLGSVTAEATSPGFDLNELGFGTRSDLRTVSTALIFRNPTQQGPFRRYEVAQFNTVSFNGGNERIEERYGFNAESQTLGFWELNGGGSWSPSSYDDRLTRGGPLSVRPAAWELRGEIITDTRRWIAFGVSAESRGDRSGKRSSEIGGGFEARPRSNVRIRLESGVSRSIDNAQYLATRDDPLATATFGRRYLFAHVDVRETNTTVRAEWTFTPYLSLQVVAQPFVSTGRFSRIGELRAPREFAFREFGTDGSTLARAGDMFTLDPDGAGPAAPLALDVPDFTVRAIRGNAVLRWEYQPGATVFVVWQLQREGDDPFARPLGGELTRLFGSPGRNVLLVKAAYWFGT